MEVRSALAASYKKIVLGPRLKKSTSLSLSSVRLGFPAGRQVREAETGAGPEMIREEKNRRERERR